MFKYLLCIGFLTSTAYSAEYGVFMVVKGKVLVENMKSSFEAKVNSKILVGDTVITAGDSRAKIVMSDRNIINISPNTKMKIEKYSNENGNKNVNLNLIEGKIRNNVEQNYDNKNSKFEVRTATAVAGVRGTQFVTSYDKSTKVTEVITLKGQVVFQSIANTDKKTKSEPVIVAKGEKSQNSDQQGPIAPVKLPEAEFKQIDSDSSVKGKEPESGSKKDKKQDGQETRRPPPRPGSQLIDLNNGDNNIKDDTATRKFEKSKLKIITQPSN